MSNSKRLSILIPAHNEEAHIYRNILEIKRLSDEIGWDYEIIVVDDGSSDDTYQNALEVAKCADNIIVKRMRANWGKGRALKYGFRFARGRFIAFLDADLDLHPRQLKSFFHIMEANGVGVVIGSKRHPESKVNYPWHRKIISNIYFYFVKMMFGLRVRDTQTGIKLFRREVLENVFPKIVVKRYAFDLEILINAHHLGYEIIEAPVVLDFRRRFGRIRFIDLLHTGIDTLAIFYRLNILKYFDRNGK